MVRINKEIMDYLHSIEKADENGKFSLKHLNLNAEELQKLRVMLGVSPIVGGKGIIDKERVKELCARAGLSHQTVSSKIGKSKSWLSTVLLNERTAYENIVDLATFFGVEPTEITQ